MRKSFIRILILWSQYSKATATQRTLDKLFFKNKLSLTVPKLQLVHMLPHTGKSSLDLRALLRCMIEKNIPFCKLNVNVRPTCRLSGLFRLKYPHNKKILSGITAIHVVAARLLIMEKLSVIFLLECLNTEELRIWQENILKTLKNWQYLSNCYSVTPL